MTKKCTDQTTKRFVLKEHPIIVGIWHQPALTTTFLDKINKDLFAHELFYTNERATPPDTLTFSQFHYCFV